VGCRAAAVTTIIDFSVENEGEQLLQYRSQFFVLFGPSHTFTSSQVYSVTSSIPRQWAIPYTIRSTISRYAGERKRIDAVHDGGVDSPRPAPSARALPSSDRLVSDNIGMLASLELASYHAVVYPPIVSSFSVCLALELVEEGRDWRCYCEAPDKRKQTAQILPQTIPKAQSFSLLKMDHSSSWGSHLHNNTCTSRLAMRCFVLPLRSGGARNKSTR
jgi:hypothetical protein